MYIGSSLNIRRRITTHKNLLSKEKHHSYKLQRAYNKYGIDNFTFEILEEVFFTDSYSKELRIEYIECLEEFYINKYNSCKRGYNILDKTGTVKNTFTRESIKRGIETRRKNGSYARSIETRRKVSEALKNNKVFQDKLKENALKRRHLIYQYDLDGNFIKEWLSAQEASDSLKISISLIRKNICGKNKRCKQYIFTKTNKEKVKSYSEERENFPKPKSKYIKMYDSATQELLHIYDNAKCCADDLCLKYNTLMGYISRPPKYIKYRLEYGEKH